MDTTALSDARDRALDEMNQAVDAMTSAETDDARAEARAAFEAAEAEVDRIDGNLKAAKRAADLANAKPDVPAVTRRAEINAAAAVVDNIKVGKGPLTYERGGKHSFIADMVNSNPAPGRSPDPEAQARLQRHRHEMDVERRDVTSTDTTGVGEMVPPLWLVDMYAGSVRAGRPLADAIGSMVLPRGTDSINIPRVTQGGSLHFQVSDNAVVAEQDMTTSSVTAAVKTVAGQIDFSMQSIEFGAINMIDQFALPELVSLYANRIETTVGTGTGSNGQFSGIIGTSGTQNVTYTTATPTAGSLYANVANAIQQVHTNRFLAPDIIVMHPRRWGWLLAQSDTTGRPLVVPTQQAPYNSQGINGQVDAQGFVGTMQGLPVLVSAAAVPTTDSTGSTNDVVLVMRRSDMLLWEASPRFRVLYEVLSGNLTVRTQLYNYAAFTAGRYPTAISAVRGVGLATPTFP